MQAKLDSFRTHISTLTPVERDALARYEGVVACTEQAKELQDQLTEIFQKVRLLKCFNRYSKVLMLINFLQTYIQRDV